MATSPPHCCSTGASTTACQRPTGALEVCLAASGTTAMKAGECNMRDGIRSSSEITEPIVHGKVEAKPQGIGVALPRLEDPRLLTGHGCFAHRKPRVDHDLASTQGRFLDHKHLFKDLFQSSLVVPFFVKGQVGGTLTLGSKDPQRYQTTDARTLEPIILKLSEVLQSPAPQAAAPSPATDVGTPGLQLPVAASSEPIIRKQERQAAIGEFSAFLATEIREPLASIRSQLEEVTGEGILDFDPQTRVENAMRDLIRIEAILNEILDYAKPLELSRHLCRIPEVLESALVVVGTDLEATRIQVTKDYANVIAPVRGDEAKLQQAFLSIFRNACEAMSPGGHLNIQVTQHRAGRGLEVQILIQNNGVPIPAEIVDKVFEPFFTTKRSGTGLGLSSVKKIVEEHGGTIAIGSAPGEGTTVTIRLHGVSRGPAFRHRGRGRRHPRRPN